MCPPWRVSELMAPLASISSAKAPSSAFRVTAYGALAGGLAGACVSVVVTLVYLVGSKQIVGGAYRLLLTLADDLSDAAARAGHRRRMH